jgi:hypothetical protein
MSEWCNYYNCWCKDVDLSVDGFIDCNDYCFMCNGCQEIEE